MSVTDSLAGPATLVSGDDGDNILEAGETWTYTATHTVQPGDPDPLANTATAKEDYAGGLRFTVALPRNASLYASERVAAELEAWLASVADVDHAVVLVGVDPAKIVSAGLAALSGSARTGKIPELWDGKAAERIAQALVTQRQELPLAGQAAEGAVDQ